MKVSFEINTWRTKSNPWILDKPIDPRIVRNIISLLREAKGDGCAEVEYLTRGRRLPGTPWTPRYYIIDYIRTRDYEYLGINIGVATPWWMVVLKDGCCVTVESELAPDQLMWMINEVVDSLIEYLTERALS